MSLLRKLERRDLTARGFDDPSRIPTNGEALYSPVLASGQGALRHWAVWACARVVADAVSTLPVDLLQGSGSSATPVDPLPMMLQRPSAHLDRVDWLSQVLVSLLTTGNAYGLIASRDRLEYPTQINLVPPGTITAEIEKIDYQAEGALFLPDNARFSYLLDLAEGQDLGKAVNEAMAAAKERRPPKFAD